MLVCELKSQNTAFGVRGAHLSVEAEGALFAVGLAAVRGWLRGDGVHSPVYLLGGGGWFEGMEGWLEVRAGHVYEV